MSIAARLSVLALFTLAALSPSALRAEDAAGPPAEAAKPAPAPEAGKAPAATKPAEAAKPAADAKPGKPGVVADGRKVSIEYTLTVDDKVADTNVGGQPLVYEQGKSQILPALEKALAGLKKGDTKKVSLTAEQGYGAVNPELLQTVPASKIPEDARKVGAMLMAENQNGQRRPVRVAELKGDEIVIDMNHPLAGKPLTFDIRVLDVE